MDREQEKLSNPGPSLPLPSIFAVSTAVMIILAGLYLYRQMTNAEMQRSIVIAAGSERGIYVEVGALLKEMLDSTDDFNSVSVIRTKGSLDN
ncbi:MAG: hypothetical protein AAGF35_09645, partial [Pseudomonadota bacterium]